VCADWLEQQGDPALAALLHLQCELAELEVYDRRAIRVSLGDRCAHCRARRSLAQGAARAVPGSNGPSSSSAASRSARVRDVDRLCRYAAALASVGIVHRIELVSGTGELDPEAELDFVETIRHHGEPFACVRTRQAPRIRARPHEPGGPRSRARVRLERLSVMGSLAIRRRARPTALDRAVGEATDRARDSDAARRRTITAATPTIRRSASTVRRASRS